MPPPTTRILPPEISDGGVEQTRTGAARIHGQDASNALDQVPRLTLRPEPLHQAGHIAHGCSSFSGEARVKYGASMVSLIEELGAREAAARVWVEATGGEDS